MAKRKKQSKVQKRKGATASPKARKVAKSARAKATKRTVARAKPKRTPVKKAAQKEAVAPAVETLVDTTEIREGGEPKPPSLIWQVSEAPPSTALHPDREPAKPVGCSTTEEPRPT